MKDPLQRYIDDHKLKVSRAEVIPLLPTMVRWFNPKLLAQLLWEVILSKVFGQYADRRLIHAALHKDTPKQLIIDADLSDILKPDDEGAIWVDFVADLGDGFDSTYAVAYLIAQDHLQVREHSLPRGQLLVMGGDEVYPTATTQNYFDRMRLPYALAYPKREDGVFDPLYCVPGNHDWYDGADVFHAMFCREKDTEIGGWSTRQRRSYFAIHLGFDVWVWAIDIQISRKMDQPQADYFRLIADSMNRNAKIIIATAEPGWYSAKNEGASHQVLGYAADIAHDAKKDFKIVAVLSGDTHHYARYSSTTGTQFITSGGGGAFLHGTHDLEPKINMWWSGSGKRIDLELECRSDPERPGKKREACYPSKSESRRMLWGNLAFAPLNLEFGVTLGLLYFPFAFALCVRPEVDTAAIVGAVVTLLFAAYTGYQHHWSGTATLSGAVHGILQFLLVGILSHVFSANALAFGLEPASWLFFAGLACFSATVIGFCSATLFGVYLLFSSAVQKINNNDAFSSMRRSTHRHFLRMRLAQNELRIFSVGLDAPPTRSGWRLRTHADNSTRSEIVPTIAMDPQLIDDEVVVTFETVDPVTEVISADEADSVESR